MSFASGDGVVEREREGGRQTSKWTWSAVGGGKVRIGGAGSVVRCSQGWW